MFAEEISTITSQACEEGYCGYFWGEYALYLICYRINIKFWTQTNQQRSGKTVVFIWMSNIFVMFGTTIDLSIVSCLSDRITFVLQYLSEWVDWSILLKWYNHLTYWPIYLFLMQTFQTKAHNSRQIWSNNGNIIVSHKQLT